jgi:uncharacterized cupredoxin-like copper-binding protein
MRLRQRVLRAATYPLAALVIGTVALFSAAACSSGRPGAATGGAVVRVTERDFRIVVARKQVPAGDVRFVIHNRGPDAHELIIARTPNSRLPLRGDGLTVNEETLERSFLRELDVPPGSAQELRLHLRRGRYELFCNMFGHYLGGMRAQLVVT